MKIQILSSGRSGSTSLLTGIVKSMSNSKLIFEPFNPILDWYVDPSQNLLQHINELNNLNQDYNIIEKNLIFFPKDLFPKSIVSFYLDYIQNFDKVILLLRKNINQVAESFFYARHTNKWHEKYFPTEKILKNVDKEGLNEAKTYNNLLLEISKKSKNKIYYYEDLFSGNLSLINIKNS